MKETPIIMSGNHPKLTMDGVKTQTRRVIKPQPTYRSNYILNWKGKGYWIESPRYDVTLASVCPYGQVGDRLWVRETFRPLSEKSIYLFTDDTVGLKTTQAQADWLIKHYDKNMPSIFMPRWASRITLEITEVRVERLREITQSDLWREGIANAKSVDWEEAWRTITEFRKLWDSLNAKRGYGWETNSWVWVIEFKLVRLNKRG